MPYKNEIHIDIEKLQIPLRVLRELFIPKFDNFTIIATQSPYPKDHNLRFGEAIECSKEVVPDVIETLEYYMAQHDIQTRQLWSLYAVLNEQVVSGD